MSPAGPATTRRNTAESPDKGAPSAANSPAEYQDEIEDHFSVKKIEPGKLWLEPFTMLDDVIGPVPVPKKVTQVCEEMWDIGGVVVKTSRGWRFLEVWSVTP